MKITKPWTLPYIGLVSMLGMCLPMLAVAQEHSDRITTIQSHHPGVNISYKKTSICDTTVNSYAGYIHLEPYVLDEGQDYPINTFFWFFESRNDPANDPLVVVLNGGPGGGSTHLALNPGCGPCRVNRDQNSSVTSPYAWNGFANLLYVDQPNEVGFSYDSLVLKSGQSPVYANDTTSNSNNRSHTSNTTTHAATAFWHFAQTWFTEFPEYKPNDEKISIVTYSYGGRYGPTFMNYLLDMNNRIADGTLAGDTFHPIQLDTLAIINGCMDPSIDALARIQYGHHNTYDFQVFDDDLYADLMANHTRPGGLTDQITECQTLANAMDTNNDAHVAIVNHKCSNTALRLYDASHVFTAASNRSVYDIARPAKPHDPKDKKRDKGNMYLNKLWVREALGVPLNYTDVQPAVFKAFLSSGDSIKGGMLKDLAYLLDHGVRVHIANGDRDFICNWMGGENSSLAIKHNSHAAFREAGYANMTVTRPTGQELMKGLTRQHGDLSFTRIFQAGHAADMFQPHALYEWLSRALNGVDIATGLVNVRDQNYSSEGPADTWWHKEGFPKRRTRV